MKLDTLKKDLQVKKKLFINGQWIEGDQYKDLLAPYTGEVIAHIPLASEQDVESAISSAYEARAAMKKLNAHQRSAILYKLSALLEEKAEEASRIIALEAAKPIATARVEVERTIQTYRFGAEEAKRIHGETLPLDAVPGGEDRLAYTVKEPLGVIGAITPFNFPMNLVAHKVAPAIAAGNTIVLKPASQTPLSAFFLAELLEEVGLPKGALNVVTGSGTTVGNQIVQDERIKMITFTGSPQVGIDIRNKAGLKRVTLELGSNAAVVIDKDIDVDAIIDRCVSSAFTYQGQMCIALQRIYVHESLYDNFVDKFIEKTKLLHIGDPLMPETNVSSLISEKDTMRVLDWIEDAKQSGAKVALGGEVVQRTLLPTVLLNVENTSKVSCQEVFAPLVIINKVSSVKEAIEYVNDSKYGLQAGLYTENIHTALKAVEEFEVGGVIINDTPTFRVDHMPYGGVKESGVGREGIKYAIEEMTEMKLVVFKK